MERNYHVLEWGEASDLKFLETTKLIENIECNLGQVYQLEDSSYLIKPLNPFGKSLRTNSKDLLKKWISECYFPTGEKVNKFYFNNRDRIESLPKSVPEIKNELYEELSLTNRFEYPDEFDALYKILKGRRKFEKFKLAFIVIIGEYLIHKNSEKNFKWGLVESKQLLNPIKTLVLIKKENGEDHYFKLEYRISGKWGYTGMHTIEAYLKQFWTKSNEIETIRELDNK